MSDPQVYRRPDGSVVISDTVHALWFSAEDAARISELLALTVHGVKPSGHLNTLLPNWDSHP